MKILSYKILMESVPATTVGNAQQQAQKALDWSKKDVKNLETTYKAMKQRGLSSEKVATSNTIRLVSFNLIDRIRRSKSKPITGIYAVSFRDNTAYFFPYVSQNVPSLTKDEIEGYFNIKLHEYNPSTQQYTDINIEDYFNNFNRTDARSLKKYYTLKTGSLFDSINSNKEYTKGLPQNLNSVKRVANNPVNKNNIIKFIDIGKGTEKINSTYGQRGNISNRPIKYKIKMTFIGNTPLVGIFNTTFANTISNYFVIKNQRNNTHLNYNYLTIFRPIGSPATKTYNIYTKNPLDLAQLSRQIDCIIEHNNSNERSKVTITASNLIP